MSKFGMVFESSSVEIIASCNNAAAPPPSISCTQIVPDGDVILDVSAVDTSRRYLVYSQVLCATSDVFRTMLGKQSKFAEAVALRESHKRDDGEPVVVTLEGDDPIVMGTVLHLLHGKYNKLPLKLNIGVLVDVSKICDKYSLHEALRIIQLLWSDFLKTKLTAHPADGLLISWVFGPEKVFTELSRDLMLGEISESDDGLLFGKQMDPLADCIPPAVSAKIFEERERCVNSFRGHVQSVEDAYLNKDWKSPAICSDSKNGRQCDTMQFGLLHQSSLLNPATYQNSLINIADTVKKIPVLKLVPSEQGGTYCRCGNYLTSGYTCNYTNAHSHCSWVPMLHKAVDDWLDTCKGLKFSEFPSRTWGN
ncbi:hypothetical protein BDD12DRAFT_866428 [Trichophaea hybrida]|nr:hypothetical protein BDD12DRAFT_866428 [Trichophaea hybrida]